MVHGCIAQAIQYIYIYIINKSLILNIFIAFGALKKKKLTIVFTRIVNFAPNNYFIDPLDEILATPLFMHDLEVSGQGLEPEEKTTETCCNQTGKATATRRIVV